MTGHLLEDYGKTASSIPGPLGAYGRKTGTQMVISDV